MKRLFVAIAALALVASGSFASLATVQGADHTDGPLVNANKLGDINDVYAFRSPTDANNLVVAISVNPLIAPGDNATRGVFDKNIVYQLHVDRNGDLGDEIFAQMRVEGSNMVIEGLGAPITAPITPPGAAPMIANAGGVKFFAGLRDDPFFFDLSGFAGFVAKPSAPGKGLRPFGAPDPTDAFAGTNILALVIEAPISALGISPTTGVIKTWVSTSKQGQRIDRMAIPAINTALIPTNSKDAFNQGSPATDAQNWRGVATGMITALRQATDGVLGNGPGTGGPLGNLSAADVAGALIPDVVTIDFSKPVQFPNGRRLTDDVIDTALGVVLNRGGAAGVSDAVNGNDKAFGTSFPYLADPWTTGAPAASGSLAPPSTGDGGLVSTSTMWTASAALFVMALLFGGAGAFGVMRNRN